MWPITVNIISKITFLFVSDAQEQENNYYVLEYLPTLNKSYNNFPSLGQLFMAIHCLETLMHILYMSKILYILLEWGLICGVLCLCRCEISKNLCCRNLAVEKAVSELPTECTFCLKQFPRSSLERHQKEECQDRYKHTQPHTLL